ncbi:unnamed protein product [Ectocarpus fasciculatus]
MPIDRAKMKLRITTDEDSTPLKEALGDLGVDSFENGGGAAAGSSSSGEGLDFLVDPGWYRDVEEAVRTVAGGRCALEVLQLSVQQEGEADMDVELMRKGLLAVKLKGEEEGRSRGKKGRGGKGGGPGGGGTVSAEEEEEEERLIMPAAGRRGKARPGSFSDDFNDNDQGRRKGGGRGAGARGEGRGAGEGGVGKRGGKKGKGARRREKEEAAERDLRQQEAQQRQEKREQAKAERLAEGDGVGADRAAGSAERDRDTRGQGGGGGSVGKAKRALVCNTCGLTFPDTGAYREHYKSDLHRYNLKLKMKGGAPVSEEEFRLVDANDFFHSDMMNR